MVVRLAEGSCANGNLIGRRPISCREVDFVRGGVSVTQPSDVRRDYTTHPKSASSFELSFPDLPFCEHE